MIVHNIWQLEELETLGVRPIQSLDIAVVDRINLFYLNLLRLAIPHQIFLTLHLSKLHALLCADQLHIDGKNFRIVRLFISFQKTLVALFSQLEVVWLALEVKVLHGHAFVRHLLEAVVFGLPRADQQPLVVVESAAIHLSLLVEIADLGVRAQQLRIE